MYVDKFNELLTKIANSESKFAVEDFDEVAHIPDKFLSYFNTVYKEDVFARRSNMLLTTGRLTGEEIRDKRVEFDKSRTMAHNACISAVSFINRLCDNEYKFEKFLPEIPENFKYDEKSPIRYEIADMVGNFVQEAYQNGIKKSKPDYQGEALDVAIAKAVDDCIDGGYLPKPTPSMDEFMS